MTVDDPFGAHGASSVPSDRRAKARRLSAKIAKGLSAEAAPGKATRRGSEQCKASSGPSQEEMQRKIEILMANPKLWQEFKQYLAETDAKTAMGTQRALREFIQKNEEIAAEDAVQVEHTRRSSGLGRSFMNSLTIDLEAEEATPNPPQYLSASNSRLGSSFSSSFSNATSMGKQFLRRAGEVATSSISGLDEEAEVSIEANESLNASVSGFNKSFTSFHTSSQDFVGVLNEWFGDEAIDEVPEEEDDEEGEGGSKEKGKD